MFARGREKPETNTVRAGVPRLSRLEIVNLRYAIVRLALDIRFLHYTAALRKGDAFCY
jgi:hypothetical protein